MTGLSRIFSWGLFLGLFLLSNPLFAQATALVIPEQSQALIQRLVAEPFPELCSSTLSQTRIQGETVSLHFKGDSSFVVTLAHPSSPKQGPILAWFKVLVPPSACPELLPGLKQLFEKRTIPDPWVEVKFATSNQAQSMKRSVYGIIVLGALLFAPCCILPWYRRRRSRWLWGLALATLAIGLRAFQPGLISNWYSIYPNETMNLGLGYVSLGLMLPLQILYDLFPATPGLDLALGLSLYAWVFLVLAAAPLADALGFSRKVGFIWALFLAAWPLMVLLGRTDSPHNAALMLWFAGGLSYQRLLHGTAKEKIHPLRSLFPMLPMTFFIIAIASIRIEAIIWILSWILLVSRRSDWLSKKRFFLAASPLIGFALSLPVVYTSLHQQGTGFDFQAIFRTDLWGTLTTTAFLRWTGFALTILGLVLITRKHVHPQGTSQAGRILLSMLLFISPGFVSEKVLTDQLTLRYFLPLACLAFLCVAVVFQPIPRLPKRYKRIVPVLSVLFILLAWCLDAETLFSPQHRLIFRHEPDFLTEHLRDKPAESVVCLADVQMNVRFPGPHYSLNAAFLPLAGAERYLGLPIGFKTLNEENEIPSSCDYYYESPICHLEELNIIDPSIAKDAHLVAKICRQWKAHATLEPIAQQRLPFLVFYQLRPGHTLDLTLYRVHSTQD